MTIDDLLSRFQGVKQTGNGWSACCPAHEDRRASLSISQGDNGGTVLHCHAGCEPEAVVATVGLTLADLMPERAEPMAGNAKTNGKLRIEKAYNYTDESGKVLFQVVRYSPKSFRQRRPGPDGWIWNLNGVRRVLFRLPQLLAGLQRPVLILEGEKDCLAAFEKLGAVVTTCPGGAAKWCDEYSEVMRGRQAIVFPDNDESGRNHVQQVAQSLFGKAEWVRIVELPGLPPKGDMSDWLDAGGTKEKLLELINATPAWTPETAATKPWPEIESFDAIDLPEFPTHALPTVLREWVEAESHATQTPADLAGLLALAVCSATIARRVVVESRPGWREPANLFVAVLLEPGNRKSAVFADAIKPLRELEAELIETARPTVARAKSDLRQKDARLKKLEKMAGEKEDAEARDEAGNLAAELAEQDEPVLPRLIVDDATSEKLGMMLAEQNGRLASMSPEGAVFDLMAGMYSKNGIPQFGVYLMGHSGDDLITDRVTRKLVRVERPALTCAYAMQPQVIIGLAEKAAFRGRGLLARFLYAAPQSWIGQREIAPTPVSDATREAYRQALRALAEMQGEHVLQLADDASALLCMWETLIEKMLGDGGQMENMRDWGGKLAGATLRLVAVLHCLERDPADAIDSSTIDAAIEIARYLIPHADAVFNMMKAKEDSVDDGACYVLRWIERHCRREFTKRDAQQHGKRRFPKAADIDAALDELVRRRYIRLRPTAATGPGRSPSPTYEVNPAAFANKKPEKRSHNSHNSAGEPDSGNSENIESASEQSETTNRVQETI